MKRTILVAAALAALVPPPALAAPKAEHASECAWYWDIAITSRAQAMESVPREAARRAIWRVFTTPVERMRVIGNAIVDAAYHTPWSEKERAGDFAAKLQRACLASGDMDSVLGTSL